MKNTDSIPRRKDRAIKNEEWIKDMLENELFCTVNSSIDGQPFARPSAYYFDRDEKAIYIHGAHSGRSVKNFKLNPKVCISVFATGAMRRHERAFEFFSEHAGVIAFGTVTVVHDNDQKHTIMQNTFSKYTPHLQPHEDYEVASQDEIDETTVFKIRIERWSGKMKWEEVDGAKRFQYKKVQSHLPWSDDYSHEDPLTLEWSKSLASKIQTEN